MLLVSLIGQTMTSKEGGPFNNTFSLKQRELVFKTGGVILFVSIFLLCFVVHYDDIDEACFITHPFWLLL